MSASWGWAVWAADACTGKRGGTLGQIGRNSHPRTGIKKVRHSSHLPFSRAAEPEGSDVGPFRMRDGRFRFRVWAPNALKVKDGGREMSTAKPLHSPQVELIGDFNNWGKDAADELKPESDGQHWRTIVDMAEFGQRVNGSSGAMPAVFHRLVLSPLHRSIASVCPSCATPAPWRPSLRRPAM